MTTNSYVLTPPPTVEKKERKRQSQLSSDELNYKEHNKSTLVPKLLLPQLAKVDIKPRRQRPFYSQKKNRPLQNSVFDIDDFFNKNNDKNNSTNQQANFLKSVLNDCNNIIMVTGAGISTHCGIPDFRSNENGLFKSKTTDKKSLFDINSIYVSKEQTLKFNQLINTLYHLSNGSEPTPFHHLIEKIASQGRLKRVYTQNIDGLENKLQSFNDKQYNHLPSKPPYPIIIPLHGTIKYTQCSKCHHINTLNPEDFITDQNNSYQDLIPNCLQCVEFEEVRKIAGIRSKGIGKLRPKIILYNEVHPEGDTIANIINCDLKSKKTDCLLIVGTTLEIPGVRQLIKNLIKNMERQKRSGRFVIIFVSNELPSNKILNLFGENAIDLIVHGDCQNLAKLV